MHSITVKAPAKVNIYLDVLGARKDGYHEIETVFRKITLCDRITIKKGGRGIRIKSDSKELPKDRGNLAYKAAELFIKDNGLKTGVEILIEKNIPIASGLGGGSSDAAAVLLGMRRLYKCRVSKSRLFELGRRIGADVGFFISGHRCAVGCGRGDEIRPVNNTQRFWYVIVTPKNKISTKEIYNLWDRLAEKRNLTETAAGDKILVHASKHPECYLRSKYYYNSLEKIVQQRVPAVSQIKKMLLKKGAFSALMSGSGPSVFGLVSTRSDAEKLKEAVCGDRLARQNGFRVFVARDA